MVTEQSEKKDNRIWVHGPGAFPEKISKTNYYINQGALYATLAGIALGAFSGLAILVNELIK